MLSRRTLLTGGAAVILGGCGSSPTSSPQAPAWTLRARTGLRRAASWLWSQQTEHGHWRSQMYGPLRSGQSLTPLALDALARVPSDALPLPRERADLGLHWLSRVRHDSGAIGLASSSADYPVYATSLAICAARRLDPDDRRRLRSLGQPWLAGQQFLDGWGDHRALGGFPMGALSRPTPPHAGHVDLSMARAALEAMSNGGIDPSGPAHQAALGFVRRARRTSGAFVYSPVEEALNKGVRIEEDGSSDGYGTPTADALLAFRALGVPADAPECADALTWLKEHHDTQANPGIGRTHASFGPSMRYYYRAVSSRAFAIYGGPADWEVEMSSALVADQQEDGSFVNAFILQKEDEPVIATSLAIVAWCATLGIV